MAARVALSSLCHTNRYIYGEDLGTESRRFNDNCPNQNFQNVGAAPRGCPVSAILSEPRYPRLPDNYKSPSIKSLPSVCYTYLKDFQDLQYGGFGYAQPPIHPLIERSRNERAFTTNKEYPYEKLL